jgi:hypothetical protein
MNVYLRPLGKKLTWFEKLVSKFRPDRIHLDNYDIYSLNTTLAKVYLEYCVSLRDTLETNPITVIEIIPGIDPADQKIVQTSELVPIEKQLDKMLAFIISGFDMIIEDDPVSYSTQNQMWVDNTIYLFIKYMLKVPINQNYK